MTSCRAVTYLLFVFIYLHTQPVLVQVSAQTEQRKPFFERLRRLDEQFRRFQEVTLMRLQGIAENYNISYNIDARFQVLTDQFQNISTVLNEFHTTASNDLNSLKFWTKKLQKKSKKLDLKVTALEETLNVKDKQALRENKEQRSLLANLTQQLQEQRNQISSLVADRDMVQGSLKDLQDGIKSQEGKMVQFEAQVRNALQNDALTSRSAHHSLNQTPQDPTPRQQDPTREQEQRSPQTSTKLQPKHSKNKKVRDRLQLPRPTQPLAPLQPLLPHPQPQAVPQLQSQPQEVPQLQPQPQAVPQLQPQPQEVPQLELQPQPQAVPQLQPQPQAVPQLQPQLKSEPQFEPDPQPLEESEVQQMQDLPELPLRHKIPRQQQVPKKPGTICNVKSMLIFPGPSTQNYVTFRKGFLARIHELSICSWLQVDVPYMGTLLSYATEENDNKLVLYGRNSSEQGSVDFVIGDPAYRQLPVKTLLDGKWHHLCIIWSSIEGKFWHYTDRRLTSTGSKFQKGYEVPSGGSFIMGQEQDSLGGGFDVAEAFVGQVAGFAVWNRALAPGEVSGIAMGKGLPRGTILTMDDIAAVHGAVQQVDCDCLEHCL
ncbi:pentraxin-4 [Amia ocellicauda]|uniref:pentraxin-4 n=1 Tax=Amia ocellicauda TaxID=2972642 RepID=UPI0034638E76